MPGVAGVFTAVDLPIVPLWEIVSIDESFAQPALAVDEVRYVGERVVALVADTLARALDAAEQVVADYEPLPPVVDPHASTVVCTEWPPTTTEPMPEGD